MGLHAQTNLARLDRGEALPTTLPYVVQTWTFGDDLAMIFLAGEVVVDYARRLKAECDGPRLWISAYCNDVPCYIASRRVIGEGGYEVDGSMIYYDRPTRLDPEAEDRIVAAVHSLLPEPFNAPQAAVGSAACTAAKAVTIRKRLSSRVSLPIIRVAPGGFRNAHFLLWTTLRREPRLRGGPCRAPGHASAFPIGWNPARGDLMDKSRSASRWRHRAGLAPSLEPLEGRRLLAAHAAQVTISEGASQGVPTLLVLGTPGADVINITDNGTNAAGNITVTLGNGGVYTSRTPVSEVEVMTRGGNDQISYTLTGPLVAERTVLTDLGSGTDQFTGNVNGNIDNTAGLDMEVYAGSGNDTMTINQSGQVTMGTFIPFMDGGRGKDTMTFNGTGSINEAPPQSGHRGWKW